MGFFTRKPTSVLGVDIGAGGVKVVELRSEKHRARLSTYGFAEFAAPSSNRASNLGDDLDAIATAIRAVCDQAKVESARTVAGLPIAAVFSAVISLPRMAKKELPAAVQWEAKKLLPLPIEQMVVDWKLLTAEGVSETSTASTQGGTTSGTTTRVLLTAAPKELVQQYLTVCKTAKLELISLETEAFALIRSLVGDDPSTVLILDIGAARTSMVIVDRGVPVLSRSVDVGGREVTQAIAGAMGTDAGAAEQFKLDMAVLPSGDHTGLPEAIAQTFAPVVQEARYSMNLFLSQEEHRGRVVEKVILAGGTAMLPSLTEFFARELSLRAFVGDPWARVAYPPDLRPALDALGPRFAVAIGLAMREATGA